MSSGETTPDAETAAILTVLQWIGDEAARPTEAAGEAQEAAAELAETLAELDAARRRSLWQGPWSARGLSTVLERMSPATAARIAAELAAPGGAAANCLADLCRVVLQQAVAAAAGPAGVLAPASVASLLLLGWQTSAGAAEYADHLRAAATPRQTEAALAMTVVPSCISRPAALLHHAAATRFGDAGALALVRGALVQRALAPLPGGIDPAALDRFAADVVAAGFQAEMLAAGGDDPDDFLVQRGAALASGLDLFATFAEPTPPDPLGTLPAVRLTALGQAILAARRQRPLYDWAAVQRAAAGDPDGYAILLGDERAAVLDDALKAARIAPEPLPS